jgi:hypothetical protein
MYVSGTNVESALLSSLVAVLMALVGHSHLELHPNCSAAMSGLACAGFRARGRGGGGGGGYGGRRY